MSEPQQFKVILIYTHSKADYLKLHSVFSKAEYTALQVIKILLKGV